MAQGTPDLVHGTGVVGRLQSSVSGPLSCLGTISVALSNSVDSRICAKSMGKYGRPGYMGVKLVKAAELAGGRRVVLKREKYLSRGCGGGGSERSEKAKSGA